jgi:hypothetical protein
VSRDFGQVKGVPRLLPLSREESWARETPLHLIPAYPRTALHGNHGFCSRPCSIRNALAADTGEWSVATSTPLSASVDSA